MKKIIIIFLLSFIIYSFSWTSSLPLEVIVVYPEQSSLKIKKFATNLSKAIAVYVNKDWQEILKTDKYVQKFKGFYKDKFLFIIATKKTYQWLDNKSINFSFDLSQRKKWKFLQKKNYFLSHWFGFSFTDKVVFSSWITNPFYSYYSSLLKLNNISFKLKYVPSLLIISNNDSLLSNLLPFLRFKFFVNIFGLNPKESKGKFALNTQSEFQQWKTLGEKFFQTLQTLNPFSYELIPINQLHYYQKLFPFFVYPILRMRLNFINKKSQLLSYSYVDVLDLRDFKLNKEILRKLAKDSILPIQLGDKLFLGKFSSNKEKESFMRKIKLFSN